MFFTRWQHYHTADIVRTYVRISNTFIIVYILMKILTIFVMLDSNCVQTLLLKTFSTTNLDTLRAESCMSEYWDKVLYLNIHLYIIRPLDIFFIVGVNSWTGELTFLFISKNHPNTKIMDWHLSQSKFVTLLCTVRYLLSMTMTLMESFRYWA